MLYLLGGGNEINHKYLKMRDCLKVLSPNVHHHKRFPAKTLSLQFWRLCYSDERKAYPYKKGLVTQKQN